MPRQKQEKSGTGICYVMQGKESKTCPCSLDLTQNAVHHYFKPGAAPDFVHYNFFKGGFFSYVGYYNPLSLWNY